MVKCQEFRTVSFSSAFYLHSGSSNSVYRNEKTESPFTYMQGSAVVLGGL